VIGVFFIYSGMNNSYVAQLPHGFAVTGEIHNKYRHYTKKSVTGKEKQKRRFLLLFILVVNTEEVVRLSVQLKLKLFPLELGLYLD